MKTQAEYIDAALVIMRPMRALINKAHKGGRTAEEDATLDQLRQDILRLWQEAREDGHSADDLSYRAGLALRGYKRQDT